MMLSRDIELLSTQQGFRVSLWNSNLRCTSTSSIDFFQLVSLISLMCLKEALLAAYERISYKLTTLFFFFLLFLN